MFALDQLTDKRTMEISSPHEGAFFACVYLGRFGRCQVPREESCGDLNAFKLRHAIMIGVVLRGTVLGYSKAMVLTLQLY